VHNLTTMHISEWVELINMLHVETFIPMVAEMRERHQENERNSSPVLIIYTTLQVQTCPCKCLHYSDGEIVRCSDFVFVYVFVCVCVHMHACARICVTNTHASI